MAKSSEILQYALNGVIGMLDISSDLLKTAINMPFAEPDDTVWVDFFDQPYVCECVTVFSLIHDAKKEAYKTLLKIKADAAA